MSMLASQPMVNLVMPRQATEILIRYSDMADHYGDAEVTFVSLPASSKFIVAKLNNLRVNLDHLSLMLPAYSVQLSTVSLRK